MNRQQYLADLFAAGQDYLDDAFEWDPDQSFDDVREDMEMTITGMSNGSYYCSTLAAEQALEGVLWDESIIRDLEDLGYNGMPTDEGPEACDVMVRYALFPYVYSGLEDYWDDLQAEREEEEEDKENEEE